MAEWRGRARGRRAPRVQRRTWRARRRTPDRGSRAGDRARGERRPRGRRSHGLSPRHAGPGDRPRSRDPLGRDRERALGRPRALRDGARRRHAGTQPRRGSGRVDAGRPIAWVPGAPQRGTGRVASGLVCGARSQRARRTRATDALARGARRAPACRERAWQAAAAPPRDVRPKSTRRIPSRATRSITLPSEPATS